MASEQFSLCWDNFHKNMSSGMNSLLENEDLVDVTLAVEGKYLKAHKMVLSVCSPYFKELFKTNPCKHPIVFMKDVSYIALSDLLQFMYQGEVQVSQENLTTFIKTAEALQIKGLTGDGNGAADNDLDSDEKSVQIVEDYKPTPQVSRSRKVQQPPTTTPSPAPKRQRLISAATSEVSTASTQPVTKTEPVASNSSDIVQFKMEPYDQTQPGAMQEESVDEAFGDESLDVTAAGDTEDYSMMEGNDEEPQAGTSAEGTGEGQELLSKLLSLVEKHSEKLIYHTSLLQNLNVSSPPEDQINLLKSATPNEMEDFDKKLENINYLNETSEILKMVGGKNVQHTTRRVMSAVLTNQLACEYNWCGRNEKQCFSSLKNLCKLIFISVRKNPLCKNATLNETEAAMKTWLRNAKDREGGRSLRLKKHLLATD